MKKQMRELLDKLEMDEDNVFISIYTQLTARDIEQKYNSGDDYYFPRVSVKFEIEDEYIGILSFRLINTENLPESEIRDLANSEDFTFYQSVASVQLYPDEESLFLGFNYFEDAGHIEQLNKLSAISAYNASLPVPLLGTYSPGYELYTFERNPYSENTNKVYGNILILNEINFEKEYNKRYITEYFIKLMLTQFKLLRYYDWVIVNPNINPEYMKENNYPSPTSQESYTKFWESFKFNRTYGKLHNNDFCLVYKI